MEDIDKEAAVQPGLVAVHTSRSVSGNREITRSAGFVLDIDDICIKFDPRGIFDVKQDNILQRKLEGEALKTLGPPSFKLRRKRFDEL